MHQVMTRALSNNELHWWSPRCAMIASKMNSSSFCGATSRGLIWLGLNVKARRLWTWVLICLSRTKSSMIYTDSYHLIWSFMRRKWLVTTTHWRCTQNIRVDRIMNYIRLRAAMRIVCCLEIHEACTRQAANEGKWVVAKECVVNRVTRNVYNAYDRIWYQCSSSVRTISIVN
jgi:hypothetical protein